MTRLFNLNEGDTTMNFNQALTILKKDEEEEPPTNNYISLLNLEMIQ